MSLLTSPATSAIGVNRATSAASINVLVLAFALIGGGSLPLFAQQATNARQHVPGTVVVLEIEGVAEVSNDGGNRWFACRTNEVLRPGDFFQTRTNSRATLRLSDLSLMRVDQLSTYQIQSTAEAKPSFVHKLWRGVIYFFHRDRPADVRFETPIASAAVRGTEFNLEVQENGTTVLTMFDGAVELAAAGESLPLSSGEQGRVEPGQRPTKTAMIEAINIIQWCLYYPAVLDPQELELTESERQSLSRSLAAYRNGDLLQALAEYPASREPASLDEKIYLAALLLAVGQAKQTEEILVGIAPENLQPRQAELIAALRTLIAAVKGPGARTARPREPGSVSIEPSARSQSQTGPGVSPSAGGEGRGEGERLTSNAERSTFNSQRSTLNSPATLNAQLSTSLLAESYYQQSLADLEHARRLAKRATIRSPQFGFAWARLAELEFSFGRTKQSSDALERALALAPLNAQALTLQGFVLAARNRPRDAMAFFDQAIAIDPALGNAWLGRGLIRMRNAERGLWNFRRSAFRIPHSALEDLQMAATLEPHRAFLRSYLGKAFSISEFGIRNSDFETRAQKELKLAQELDPNDPTAWLYSALVKEQDNEVNAAVRDLEKSQDLNDNRRVYRSQFLLDQDRAVRSSSLATLYQRAGLNDVALREAAKAVSYDYANYSAHQFLSDSYNALRDPTRFNLRYETVWFNELLLANLLSPVGGTPLSQHISQQEYSRLFERNRIGLTTDTSYRSDGQYREIASQYGVIDDTAWSLDLDYQHNNGIRPNNRLDRVDWVNTLKHQLNPRDSALLFVKYLHVRSGDNFQYFDPASIRRGFKFEETQNPDALVGFHREWAPGSHTLALVGHLSSDLAAEDTNGAQRILTRRRSDSNIVAQSLVGLDSRHRISVNGYTAELQQVYETERGGLTLGGRLQSGEIETDSLLKNPSVNGDLFRIPPADLHITDALHRLTGYGYYSLRPLRELAVIGGVSYDRLTAPKNFRWPPIADGEIDHRKWSPKAALVWAIIPQVVFRASYTRSLGGVGLEESYRLEPSQLSGFVQTYRTIIPESVAGSVSAPTFETMGAAIDLKPTARTFISVRVERLASKVDQIRGVFDYFLNNTNVVPPIRASSTPQHLDYRENSVTAAINELLDEEWSLGVVYRWTQSEFSATYPLIPTYLPALPDQRHERLELQELTPYLLYNHRSGIFTRFESQLSMQTGIDFMAGGRPLPRQSFAQVNVSCGYRFPRQRGQIAIGGFNLLNQDYRLNPLNQYSELPRSRLFWAGLRIRF